MSLNKTHALNIRKWFILNEYVVIRNYPNEFSPYSWHIYVNIKLPTSTLTSIQMVVTRSKTISITRLW